jgi:hypothetical protein
LPGARALHGEIQQSKREVNFCILMIPSIVFMFVYEQNVSIVFVFGFLNCFGSSLGPCFVSKFFSLGMGSNMISELRR